MQFLFEVELEGKDEPIEVRVDSRDVRRWESEYEKSWLDNTMSLTTFAQLAWIACRRQKLFDGSWDDFDAVCVSVEHAEEPEKSDPTKKARTGARSSR